MNKINQIDDNAVNEAIAKVDLRSETSIQEAASMLLGGNNIKPGDKVVQINDNDSFPYQGIKGTAKGASSKGSGWTDVEYPDGVVVPVMTNLLLPV